SSGLLWSLQIGFSFRGRDQSARNCLRRHGGRQQDQDEDESRQEDASGLGEFDRGGQNQQDDAQGRRFGCCVNAGERIRHADEADGCDQETKTPEDCEKVNDHD
ncbi:hypothetical protein N9A70_02485, partial [Akkermansiaceae bacterium]|nr:hypothetical protein [Akkermansiaceae bacterium]MDB4502223.1 hypothetical protein [Akkermansiaceae bacterium]